MTERSSGGGAAAAPRTQPRTADSVSRSPRQLWRAARGPVLFGAGLIAVAAVLSLGAEPSVRGDLDPESAGPEGTRALVRILADQGSDVTVARNAEDAAAAAEENGGDSALLVVQSHRLTPAHLKRLAAVPGDRVLVQPTTGALEAFAPEVRVSGRGAGRAPDAGCALPAAEAAGSADLDGERYGAPAEGATSCYSGSGEKGASLVRTADEGRTTTVLGGSEFLRNENLSDEGNAALALNLVGAGGDPPGDVVFAIPDTPVPGGEQTLWDLTPFSIRLSLGALAAALLLVALWRGRRLGPLVAESLPVVVRAAETTEGRAGLYVARRSRDRAAAALRGGVIGRLRPAFGLGPDAPPDSVVDAVAARSGADPGEVAALLYGYSPAAGAAADPFTADDAGLVRLADELDRLEAILR